MASFLEIIKEDNEKPISFALTEANRILAGTRWLREARPALRACDALDVAEGTDAYPINPDPVAVGQPAWPRDSLPAAPHKQH